MFFGRNHDFFSITQAVNPLNGRVVKAVHIRTWAIDAPCAEPTLANETDTRMTPPFSITTAEERYAAFMARSNAAERWMGADTADFMRGIISGEEHPELHAAIDRQLQTETRSRKEVAHLVADPTVDTLFAALDVCVGPMRSGSSNNAPNGSA